MHVVTIRQWLVRVVLGLWVVTGGEAIVYPSLAIAQQAAKTEAAKTDGAQTNEVKTDAAKTLDLPRKVKIKVAPVYPAMARRMRIGGTVRLAVVVSSNGGVKSSRAIGGHPLLVDAAMDAVKRWKFEPGPGESSGVVEFKFEPRD